MKNLTAEQFREKILNIRGRLLSNLQSYESCKEELLPFIDEMNRRGKNIAKKYNKKYKNINFSSLMR